MNALADVGRYLRRRRVQHPPAVCNEGERKSEHRGHRPLQLGVRAEPGGHATQRHRDTDRQQVERIGDELGADQHRRRDLPRPLDIHCRLLRCPVVVAAKHTAPPSTASRRCAASRRQLREAPSDADLGYNFLFESARCDSPPATVCGDDFIIMPIYEYRCSECGHELEALQKLADARLLNCPACHADALVKKVSAAGFQLKGSGWYVTDFRNGNKSKPAAKTDDSAAKSDAPASDAKPDTKSDAPPKTEAASKSESAAKTETAAKPASAKSESTPAKKPAAAPSSGGSSS